MKPPIKLSTLIALSIIFNFPVVAQTSTDLQNKFDSPMREFYQINANVGLGVMYGEDKQLCSVTVTEKYFLADKQPAFRLDDKSRSVETRKSEKSANDVLSDIIKSLSPPLNYGKLVKDYGSDLGNCFYRGRVEYENVNIFLDNELCNPSESSHTIEWKRQECKSTQKYPYLHW